MSEKECVNIGKSQNRKVLESGGVEWESVRIVDELDRAVSIGGLFWAGLGTKWHSDTFTFLSFLPLSHKKNSSRGLGMHIVA